MGLDLSSLASEKLSRSEAIDLMIEEARAASKQRTDELEGERKALSRLTREEAVEMLMVGSESALDGRGDRAEFLNRYDGNTHVHIELTFAADDPRVPLGIAAKVRRAGEIELLIKQEREIARALADRTRVRSALLRGILAESFEGRALLDQLGDAAERFREVIRGKVRALGGR